MIFFRPDWKERIRIGSGGFGTVFKCSLIDNPSVPVAIKTIDKLSEDDKEKLSKNEGDALSVSHPNLARVYGVCAIDAPDYDYGIMMEYANLGSLVNNERNAKGEKIQLYKKLNNAQTVMVCLDISEGLNYLHSKNLIHRDLKLENILLIGGLDKGVIAKIADFGLTREIAYCMTNMIGTTMYMAPELAQNKPKYDFKVDIYSFTIIIYELFKKDRFPFPSNMGNMETYQAVRKSEKPPIPSKLSQKLSNLISAGWSKNPSDRPASNKFTQVFQSILDRLDLPKENLLPNQSNVTFIEYFEDVKSQIFLSTQIFDEGNTNEAFGLLIDEFIKKQFPYANFILPHVLTALKSTLIKEDQFTNILNSFGWIGLLVSMLKIDHGHDVLLIGESLCPVEVVAIFRCLVGSGHTGSFTVWTPNFSREQKRFDAICHICPNTHIPEEALVNLLKDDGTLLVYKDDTIVSIFETISLQSLSFEFFVFEAARLWKERSCGSHCWQSPLEKTCRKENNHKYPKLMDFFNDGIYLSMGSKIGRRKLQRTPNQIGR